MIKPMWNSEAVKAYESGQGVELVNKPYPHYEPAKVTRKQDDDDIQDYVRPWVGLTDGEVDKMILLMGFPPDWITENAIVKNIVRNLEAKLKEKNT